MTNTRLNQTTLAKTGRIMSYDTSQMFINTYTTISLLSHMCVLIFVVIYKKVKEKKK